MIKIPASYSTELSGSGSAISPPHELRQRVKMRLNGFLARRFRFVIDDHPASAPPKDTEFLSVLFG